MKNSDKHRYGLAMYYRKAVYGGRHNLQCTVLSMAADNE